MSLSTRKLALITGASSGIGRATALALAQASVDLILVSRSASALETVAQEVRPLGVEALIYPLDLLQEDTLPENLQTLIATHGCPDVLINNAGMGYTGSIADMPLHHWQRLFQLNVTSVLQCVQAVLPGMRQRGQGLILNVASVAAYQVFPNWGAYCASKAALVSLSKAIALEERNRGIRVTVIAPGSVNTPLWDTDTVQADFDRQQMLRPEVVAAVIRQAVQLPPEAVLEELHVMPSGGTF